MKGLAMYGIGMLFLYFIIQTAIYITKPEPTQEATKHWYPVVFVYCKSITVNNNNPSLLIDNNNAYFSTSPYNYPENITRFSHKECSYKLTGAERYV